jgi:hypothetical protein
MERGRIARLGWRIGFALVGQQWSGRVTCFGPGFCACSQLGTPALTKAN